MNQQPLDIFNVRIQLGKCGDLRPCIVIYPERFGKVTVLSISGQGDLCNSASYFVIETDHHDFSATGLDRRSFIIGIQLDEIEVSRLKKRLGRLEGDLAREFKGWYGL